jgi:hypothetical protein
MRTGVQLIALLSGIVGCSNQFYQVINWPTSQPTANQPPVADAGPDINATVGQTVTLSALGSTDPDNDRLTFQWAQTAGPVVVITDADQPEATFVPTQAEAYDFIVTVNDGRGGSDVDGVRVTVVGPGTGGDDGSGSVPTYTTISLCVENLTPSALDPELYISGQSLDGDALFAEGQHVDVGPIPPGETNCMSLDCTAAVSIGSQGGTFSPPAEADETSPLVAVRDIDFACGDKVTFRFESDAGGVYRIMLLVSRP